MKKQKTIIIKLPLFLGNLIEDYNLLPGFNIWHVGYDFYPNNNNFIIYLK